MLKLKLAAILFSCFAFTQLYAQPQIVNFSPDRYSMQNSQTTAISVEFDVAMSPASFQSATFLIYGEQSGFATGSINYDSGTQTATFTPTSTLNIGETVTVTLTQGIQDAGGAPLASPFQWVFYVHAGLGEATFSLDTGYPAGDGPNFVTLANLTPDTSPDVAVPHSLGKELYTWWNSGDGSLEQKDILSVGNQPRSSAAGDFDSDGDLDVAVANENSNDLSLFDNDGAGNLTPRVSTVTVGSNPDNVNTGDLNGDGFLDLVIVNGTGSSVSVLLNLGNGNFQTQVEYTVGQEPQASQIADFNNDGFLDIVVTNNLDGTLSLLLNNGSGAFPTIQTFPAGALPHAIDSHDFNGDGLSDVAVTNRAPENTVSILLNTGGALGTPNTISLDGDDPLSVHAGDWNGDGAPDWVVANRLSNNIQVYLNEGSGTFQFKEVFATQADPRAVASSDLNGDGVLDLVVANWAADSIQTFFNVPAPNQAPAAPELLAPVNRIFLTATPVDLTWSVPVDLDGQLLHFKVEVSQNPDFSNILFTFDSQTDDGFTPVPPVDQSTAAVSFNLTTLFSDGVYWWRVSAWDGFVFGQASAPRSFVIDSVFPGIDFLTLTNPDFSTFWYNQDATPVADISMQYDETNADRIEFQLSSIGIVQITDGIPGGTNQAVSTQIDISSFADDTYQLTATVFDSAGNQTPWLSVIGLDATPPAGTEASSPPTSAETSFNVSWGGTVEDGSGISTYDVRVQIDGGAWQDWMTGLTTTSAQYDGAHGSSYGFEASARDNVGNSEPFTDIAETSTVVDTAANDISAPGPPLSLTANGSIPSPWQNTSNFLIEWQEPADASGIARALYKLGTTPPSTNFDSTGSVSGTLSLTINATVENGQNFYLWFEDGAGNINFQNNALVTLLYDITPPTGTIAQSVDTSSTVSFIVHWGGGSDGAGSGLDNLYNVRYQENGGAWQAWFTNTSDTLQVFTTGNAENTYGFEAVVFDIAGNVELFSSTPETETVIDTGFADLIPPTIIHTPPGTIDQGQDLTIEAEMIDNAQIIEATLLYTLSGQSNEQMVSMSRVSGNTFAATLTSAQVGFGMNYYFSASDGTNISVDPPAGDTDIVYNLAVRILGTDNQGLVKPTAQPGGETQAAYRMISVPLILQNPGPSAVLEDDFGQYDGTLWRLFQYQPATDDYLEFPNTDPFSPGKAHWLIVRQPNLQVDSGVGNTVPTNEVFNVTLEAGWNDIANPFVFPIAADNMQIPAANELDVMGPYSYNGDWVLPDQVTTLQPWEGYSVFSQTGGVIISFLPLQSTQETQNLDKLPATVDWQVGIEARCADAFDQNNYLGVSQFAAPEWDGLDYLEPPYITDYVSVRFPHDDWQIFSGVFATDFRPTFSDGQKWHFEVKTNIPDHPVELRFKNLEMLPANFQAILVDNSTLQKMDLRRMTEYSFLPNQNSLNREFDLIIGTKGYIENSQTGTVPETYQLSQNYPNPFNAGTSMVYQVPEQAHVSIRVLNVLGQEVKSLTSKEHTAGNYRIYWDGTSDTGHDMSSGIYLIRFESGDFQQTRKIVLIR